MPDRELSPKDTERAASLEVEIRDMIIHALKEGDPDDKIAGDLVAKHSDWIKIFWPEGSFSAEKYRALADKYLSDERFKNYYDKWIDGATKYLAESIKKYY